jgi:hypothetical protein
MKLQNQVQDSQIHLILKDLHPLAILDAKSRPNHWKTEPPTEKKATQERYYSQFDQTPSFYIKEDLKLADRLSFATFTQMKIGHISNHICIDCQTMTTRNVMELQ